MVSNQSHRGPDASGFYSDDHVELGHTRLSIIDVGGGSQPMADPTGRYRIVFNGEIYNYIELRRQLEARGVVFQTQSDTEVLLMQYVVHGMRGLDNLNGMFAFAIWDCLDRTLFLARDRIGIKPLHYAMIGSDIVFGSEIKAVVAHPAVRRAIRPTSIASYFAYGYVPAPETIYEDVRKVEPGHCALWRNGNLDVSRYWDIPLCDRPVCGHTFDESVSVISDLLEDAVAKQLRSDVPVGVFLSGGLDSSLVTAIASRRVSSLATFSIGFEERSYDESRYAALVAARCHTVHRHEILTASHAAAIAPSVLAGMDEPLGDASLIPTFALSRLAAGSVKTVLGGDGGDELFAGYPAFAADKLVERLSILPVHFRDAVMRLARQFPVSSHYASASFLLDQFFKGAGISREARFMTWMGIFGNDQRNALLHDDVRRECLRHDPYADIVRHVMRSGLSGGFERLLYLCAKMYLQDGVLVKVDRASMMNSLEVRVPFLDHALVEYASGIQQAYKLRALTSKYILKKAAKGIVPAEIIDRRKAGFMMPLADWIRGDLRDQIMDVCLSRAGGGSGLFNRHYVSRMLNDHLAGRRDYRKMIWALYAFLSWFNQSGRDSVSDSSGGGTASASAIARASVS